MNEVRFDKYRLIERISHGGMAEVFRAKTFGAAGFEREVAIKLLLPTVAMDREFITMLIDEAKIAGQLSHANIAQIFDLGMAEGRYYIVQEYVSGRDLRAIIRRCRSLERPLSVAQACHIMLKVCEGLDYAHNKRDANNQPLNLVHRDVSPQNILVSMDGQVKLIDFGIAKAEGRATRTLAGLVKGKFAYMSPEQIRGLPVDRRSDVFACGIVFHELLTTKPLFLRKSEFETLKRARSGEIEPPSDANPEVPAQLDEIVLTALARHVDDRYQSAQSFREALWDFVKSSGKFYSQGLLSDWMNDKFGSSDDHTQTAVTTERDREVIKPSVDGPEGGPTGDEIGRTSEAKKRPQRPDQMMGMPLGNQPSVGEAGPDAGATVPEIPASHRARPRSEATTDVDGARPPKLRRAGTNPSPFGRADARQSNQPPPTPASGPGEPGAAGDLRPTAPYKAARPPHPGGSTGFPARPPGLAGGPGPATHERKRPRAKPSAVPPLPGKPAIEPASSRLSVQRTVPFAGRTSRHSMRALTEQRSDDLEVGPPPKKRRINLIVAAALFLLLVAGAASISLSLMGDDHGDSHEQTDSSD